MKKTFTILFALLLIAAVAAFLLYRGTNFAQKNQANEETTEPAKDVEETSVLPPISATAQEVASTPSDRTALGGYNVLIADRGNNRLVEVTPDKNIVWQYQFNLPRMGLGADDSFFTNGGKDIITNLEDNHEIILPPKNETVSGMMDRYAKRYQKKLFVRVQKQGSVRGSSGCRDTRPALLEA